MFRPWCSVHFFRGTCSRWWCLCCSPLRAAFVLFIFSSLWSQLSLAFVHTFKVNIATLGMILKDSKKQESINYRSSIEMQHIVCKYELYPAMLSYFYFCFHFAIRTWIKPNPASIGLKTTLLSGQIQTIEIPAIENAVPGHLISVSHTKYIVACFLIGQMGPQGATRPIKWKGLYVQISLFFIMTIRCLTIYWIMF